MAFNSVYNNNQPKQENSVTIYSAYRMNNAESTIDPTCITFRFWKNSLCIGIFPKKQTGNDEIAFDMDNGITIYLSHTKARILKHELELFLKDPVTYNAVGVPSGQAIITFSNGAEFGKNSPVVIIRKVGENGEVVSSFTYEFKTDYHFSVRNYNGGTSFDRVYEDYKSIELEQFITVLDEYIKATTNAIAFTVMDQRKYSADRTERKIDAIATALGVETFKTQNGGGARRNSYFNSPNSGNSGSESTGYTSTVAYGSATIDDLE